MKNLREEFLQLFVETSPNKLSPLPNLTEILVYQSFEG